MTIGGFPDDHRHIGHHRSPFNESDARIYAEAIVKSENCRISAATFLETAIVIEAQTENAGIQQFDAFIRRAGIIVEPVTQDQAQIARQAYSDFGKGRHPAGLNFGDCFSYALAKPLESRFCSKARILAKPVSGPLYRILPGKARQPSADDHHSAVSHRILPHERPSRASPGE